MHDPTFTQRRAQHAAYLVAATTQLFRIDSNHIKRNRQRRRCTPDCDRGRVLVGDLRKDNYKVDVAGAVFIASSQRAEQDDLQRIKLLNDCLDNLRKPLEKRTSVVATVGEHHGLGAHM
ncbi:hypothetical protein BH23ACT10_BH23ACT10_37440 [soil metagenome]